MVIKEWRCKDHGDFEGSHPICPGMGCRSQSVERVFLTPPGFKSDALKRHEAGIKQLAQDYGQSDFRSARSGETSKARSVGDRLLWGDEGAKAIGMSSFGDITARTSQPFTVQRPDGRSETVPHGMQQAARDVGITALPVPKAAGGLTVHKSEQQMRNNVA